MADRQVIQLVTRSFAFKTTQRPTATWDCVPGLVSARVVAKRRARNKAASQSRQRNRRKK